MENGSKRVSWWSWWGGPGGWGGLGGGGVERCSDKQHVTQRAETISGPHHYRPARHSRRGGPGGDADTRRNSRSHSVAATLTQPLQFIQIRPSTSQQPEIRNSHGEHARTSARRGNVSKQEAETPPTLAAVARRTFLPPLCKYSIRERRYL